MRSPDDPASAGPTLAPAAPAPTAQGGRRLDRSLSSVGVLLLTLSCLSPVFSIYGIGADVLQHAGRAAIGLFALGFCAAVIWAVVYAELGSAYPYAGGDYVGVAAILGPCAGFVTLVLWAVTSGPSAAFEAQVLATYVGDLAPALSHASIIIVALAAALFVALMAVRGSSLITGLFVAVEMVAVLGLVACGLSQPLHILAGSSASLPHAGPAGFAPVTFAALASAAVNAAFGTVGGNQAIGFGEELKDPHHRMGGVIIAACLVGAAATALPVIAVVLGARDLPALLASPAPFTAFVTSIAGRTVGRAVDVIVALAIFNALIVQLMWLSRLVFSLGRDGVLTAGLNSFLARVHAGSGAPRAATWTVGAFTALCCLVPSHALLVFMSGLVVYAFGLVNLAVLKGRARGLTARPGYWRSWFFPAAPILGLALVAAFAAADLCDAETGRPSLILLGLAALAAAAWYTLRLRTRPGGWTPRFD